MTTITVPRTVCAVTPTRFEIVVLAAASRVQTFVARRMVTRAARSGLDAARRRALESARDAALAHSLGRGV